MDRIEHAKIVSQSSLIPAEYRGKPADIIWAMDIGDALGVPYTQVMQSMVVARGKMTMSADLMGAIVRRAGHKLRIHEEGNSVTASIVRADDPDYEFTVTWNEKKAREAGLWGNRGPWTQYPRQMLRARAITEVCRQGASDALAGNVYTAEELTSEPRRPLERPAETEAANRAGAQGKARRIAENASGPKDVPPPTERKHEAGIIPDRPATIPAPNPEPASEQGALRNMTRTMLMDYCKETGASPGDVWKRAQEGGASMDDPDSLEAVLTTWQAGKNPEGDQ
jgi:hypothetical protein